MLKRKPRSEETKRKISESLKGRPCTPERREKLLKIMNSEEVKKKMSQALKGRHIGVETKRKMSEARKGRTITEGIRRKISESEKGKVINEETRRMISTTHKESKLAAEHLKKLHASMKGKKHTEETKRRWSETRRAKNRHCSEETKNKIGNANRGENCGTWLGGISFLPYCHKFNNRLKEKIRDRDNRTCQLCGEKENGSRLHIHHVHYDKENCEPDLVALCHKCHSKVNHNRNYYEILFINKLEKRGLLTTRKI
jgi:5-methylcytosine-specific restriction endonuclease McrA